MYRVFDSLAFEEEDNHNVETGCKTDGAFDEDQTREIMHLIKIFIGSNFNVYIYILQALMYVGKILFKIYIYIYNTYLYIHIYIYIYLMILKNKDFQPCTGVHSQSLFCGLGR